MALRKFFEHTSVSDLVDEVMQTVRQWWFDHTNDDGEWWERRYETLEDLIEDFPGSLYYFMRSLDGGTIADIYTDLFIEDEDDDRLSTMSFLDMADEICDLIDSEHEWAASVLRNFGLQYDFADRCYESWCIRWGIETAVLDAKELLDDFNNSYNSSPGEEGNLERLEIALSAAHLVHSHGRGLLKWHMDEDFYNLLCDVQQNGLSSVFSDREIADFVGRSFYQMELPCMTMIC